MTSKERLRLALNHQEPDRVPYDLDSTVVSGISIVALQHWLDVLQLPHEPLEIGDVIQQLGKVPESLLQYLKVDTRAVNPDDPAGWELKFTEDDTYRYFVDEWGITWRMPKEGGHYFDMYRHPLKDIASIEEIKAHPWPNPSDATRYANLKAKVAEMKRLNEAGIVLGRMGAGIVEIASWVRGVDNFYMDLAADPKLACYLMDTIAEIKMVYWEKALDEIGEDVMVVPEADDLAGQDGLLISLEMYRKLIKPRHEKLLSFIRRRAPHVKIFFHCCGSVRDLIPDLIDVGVDIINPVQVSAKGMGTKELKRLFGSDITFWGGGVDTQKILPWGTPERVRDEVKRRIDDLAPGGGFVFSAVHNIQADVPTANLIAMWETLQEYGKY